MPARSTPPILLAALLLACGGDAPAGDAGPPDASGSDAGRPMDAGELDSGRSDSGPSDGGLSDGGAGDGGDAGPHGRYPVDVTVGSCELLWERWGPTAGARSGDDLLVRGTEVYFVEHEGEQSFLLRVDGLDGSVLTREPIGSADEQRTLVLAGDLNADGTADLVLSGGIQLTEVADSGVASSAGIDTRIAPLSGVDFTPLWTREEHITQLVSYPVAAVVGDRDGDEVSDLVLAPTTRPRPPLLLLSGATGEELGTLPLPDSTEKFGDRLVSAGDLSGDGVDDLYAGDAFGPSDHFGYGSVYAYDGASGAVLWSAIGAAIGGDPWLLGGADIAAADLDGDGLADLVASATHARVGTLTEAGKVLAYSGADGTVLWAADGTRMWEQLGTSLSAADDLDGDGRPEVLAGAAGSPFVLEGNGRAAVLRGSDGTVLVEVRSRAVERCEDPVSPGRRCYPDSFGAARALSGAGDNGLVIVFGTPRALDPDDQERGNVMAMRCTP